MLTNFMFAASRPLPGGRSCRRQQRRRCPARRPSARRATRPSRRTAPSAALSATPSTRPTARTPSSPPRARAAASPARCGAQPGSLPVCFAAASPHRVHLSSYAPSVCSVQRHVSTAAGCSAVDSQSCLLNLQPCPAIACAWSSSYAISGPTGDSSTCRPCCPVKPQQCTVAPPAPGAATM